MITNYLDIDTSVKKATREAFGQALCELIDEGENIVAVDADLTGSTTLKKVGEKYPERLINAGIAEQNMIDVAAGLSLAGLCAFTGSFAVFGTGRCYDQIRNTVCYSNLNVKICPTHAGISVGPDGGSHQMLEDVALMQVLPRMKVLVPADYNSCSSALKLVAKTQGPAYVRQGRAKLPQIYSGDVDLKIGGSFKLKEGSDVTIVACGVEVAQALKASDLLENAGIKCDVIDAYSIKPLDSQTIVESTEKTRRVVVCEEHSVYGGLSSSVSQLLSGECPCKIASVAVSDHFGTSGEFDELLHKFKIDFQAIKSSASSLLH